jgi:hypothetical protein
MSHARRTSAGYRGRQLLGAFASILGLAIALFAISGTVGAQGGDEQVADRDLPYMALPVAELGDKFPDYEVDPFFSGFGRREDLGVGEMADYTVSYIPTSSAGWNGPLPTTEVELYADTDAARAEFTDGFDELRQAIESLGGAVETFDVSALGDEVIGVTATFEDEGIGYRYTLVVFRTGRILGASIIDRIDLVDSQEQAVTIGQALLARIKGVESGEVTDLPGILPPDVNCDSSVNSIDATLVLQLSASMVDVASIRCGFLGDANGDRSTNAIDAAVILQRDAGLMSFFADPQAPGFDTVAAKASDSRATCHASPLHLPVRRGACSMVPNAVTSSAPDGLKTPTPIMSPGEMSSAVLAVDCDVSADGIQSECSYPNGASFEVQLVLTQGIERGYVAFDAQILWQDSVVDYVPTDSPQDEALWKACNYALRVDDRTFVYDHSRPAQPSVHFGCVEGPRDDSGAFLFSPELDAGAIAQFEFRCTANGTSTLELLPRDSHEYGTYFLHDMQEFVDPVVAGATIACGPGQSANVTSALAIELSNA